MLYPQLIALTTARFPPRVALPSSVRLHGSAVKVFVAQPPKGLETCQTSATCSQSALHFPLSVNFLFITLSLFLIEE